MSANTQALGNDYLEVIETLIHEYVAQIHETCTGSKSEIEQFLELEEEIITQCRFLLNQYEKYCKKYRSKNNLTPFQWSKETIQNVRLCLHITRGKGKRPLSVEERAKSTQRYLCIFS